MDRLLRWRLVCPLVFCGYLLTVQTQLPASPAVFSGTVVDGDGKPLGDVWIGNRKLVCKTDAQGNFAGTTSDPVVVFRKIGYQSVRFRTEARTDIRITLLPASRSLPACDSTAKCSSLKGWHSRLCFPKVPRVKVAKQSADVDYGIRSLTFKTPEGTRSITHGSGPLWSFGLPLDEPVWESVEYSETVYRRPDIPSNEDNVLLGLVDARGKLASGKQWRTVGLFGESADYSDADPESARVLDKVFDGVCIQKPR